MMDTSLLKHTLALLKLYDGRPTAEEAIASDAELRSGRKLSLDQVQTCLGWLKDKGMASSRVNMLDKTVWTITEIGRSVEL